MEKAELIAELDQAAERLLLTLDTIPADRIDTVPFPGSWTAGQLAEHLLKSGGNLPRLFQGASRPADRAPNALEEQIRTTFLDFSTKMQSPDFVRPTEPTHDKAQLMTGLRETLAAASDAVRDNDLTHLCLDFEFPTWGALTRFEWGYFVACHVRRHTHQLQNIANALT